jgi:hypothetical protein
MTIDSMRMNSTRMNSMRMNSMRMNSMRMNVNGRFSLIAEEDQRKIILCKVSGFESKGSRRVQRSTELLENSKSIYIFLYSKIKGRQTTVTINEYLWPLCKDSFHKEKESVQL